MLRARDLVRFGIDGHRFGPRLRTAGVRRRVDEILESVGASAYADVPLGMLSGGERQRVRIGQALATDPRILLCDEPLLSLDLHHQRAVTELIDARRRSHGTAVVFVTHEINPVLGLVDRVLYLARGGHRVGTPDEVLTSESLSQLYGTQVDVVRVRGRVVVAGAPDEPAAPPHHPERVHETDGVRVMTLADGIWHQIFDFDRLRRTPRPGPQLPHRRRGARARRRAGRGVRPDAGPAVRGARHQRAVLRGRLGGAAAGRERRGGLDRRLAPRGRRRSECWGHGPGTATR